MKIQELKERLDILIEEGFGEAEVMVYETDNCLIGPIDDWAFCPPDDIHNPSLNLITEYMVEAN